MGEAAEHEKASARCTDTLSTGEQQGGGTGRRERLSRFFGTRATSGNNSLSKAGCG